MNSPRKICANSSAASQSLFLATATPITLLPLATDFRIDGPILAASTLDVSCGGLALLSRQPLAAKYLAIEFLDAGARMPALILRPSRCRPLGPAYAIAGDFVSRIQY